MALLLASCGDRPLPLHHGAGAGAGGAGAGSTTGAGGGGCVYCAPLQMCQSGRCVDRFVEFTDPPPKSGSLGPWDITTGPDGNIWFTQDGPSIGRATLDGAITEFALPPSIKGAYSITAGPDGNLWFTEFNGSTIGRITTDGAVTLFPVGPGPRETQNIITAGPDGALWFTESAVSLIGRITPGGAITEVAALPGSEPFDIATGADGSLWFTMLQRASHLGRIVLDGQGGAAVSELAATIPLSWRIAAGTDGKLWLTGINPPDQAFIQQLITWVTPDGMVGTAKVGDYRAVSPGIAAARDGTVWFTLNHQGSIAGITGDRDLTFTVYPTSSGSHPFAITAGPDGNIWFTEEHGIGRFVPP